MNGPNPGGLGFTEINQATMDYMLFEGPGRDDFIRYWKLMAEAVMEHPSAFAAELMNEPMSSRGAMYDTWRATAEAINAIIPDMSVSLSDIGEGAIIPHWLSNIRMAGIFISPSTIKWIKESQNLFYAWHWYGDPKDPNNAIKNALAVGKAWNVPTMLTEFMSCDIW